MNATIRTEAAIARLAVAYFKGAKMKDFMPWPKEPEVEATPEDFMNMLRAAKKETK